MKLTKRQYYNQYFLENTYDSKRIWKGIKQIIHFKPQASQKFIRIVDNNNEISDPKLIANAFNKYFGNIGNNLASSIPDVHKTPSDYLNTPTCNSFFISPTTSQEIENEISYLKIGKATGPYSIPIDVLKILKSVVSKPLESIFNASFMIGIVPSDFKLANIIPVYKSGSQTCLCNYRPISWLSVFNKILEKLMYKRLLIFLEKNNNF